MQSATRMKFSVCGHTLSLMQYLFFYILLPIGTCKSLTNCPIVFVQNQFGRESMTLGLEAINFLKFNIRDKNEVEQLMHILTLQSSCVSSFIVLGTFAALVPASVNLCF